MLPSSTRGNKAEQVATVLDKWIQFQFFKMWLSDSFIVSDRSVKWLCPFTNGWQAHCRHTLGQRIECHLIDTVINIICIGILSHPDFKDYVRRSKSPDHGLITSAWHSILCSFPEGTKDELLYFWVYSPYLATHTSWADWIKQEFKFPAPLEETEAMPQSHNPSLLTASLS